MKRTRSAVTCLRVLFLGIILTLGIHSSADALGFLFTEQGLQLENHGSGESVVIHHKAGQETLFAEYCAPDFNGGYAWLIPIPEKPTSVYRPEADVTWFLSWLAQPGIQGSFATVYVLALCLLYLSPWLTLTILAVRLSGWGRSTVRFLVFLALSFCLWCILCYITQTGEFLTTIIVGQSSGRFAPNSAYYREFARLDGGVKLQTLHFTDIGELDDWLTREGLGKVPEAGRAGLSECIAKNMHFVAATNSDTEKKGNHGTLGPAAIEFPSPEPILPCSAQVGKAGIGSMSVYVIAESTVTSDALRLSYAARFVARQMPLPTLNQDIASKSLIDGLRAASEVVYVSPKLSVGLGLPSVKKHFWDGCWVSFLQGDARPLSADQDVHFHAGAPRAYRPLILSHEARHRISMLIAILFWYAVLFLGAWICRHTRMYSSNVLAALGILIVASPVTYGVYKLCETQIPCFVSCDASPAWMRCTVDDLVRNCLHDCLHTSDGRAPGDFERCLALQEERENWHIPDNMTAPLNLFWKLQTVRGDPVLRCFEIATSDGL